MELLKLFPISFDMARGKKLFPDARLSLPPPNLSDGFVNLPHGCVLGIDSSSRLGEIPFEQCADVMNA